jgi:two-component system response regulator AtoC
MTTEPSWSNGRQELPDRRRVPRGGRRAGDRPGRFPRVLIADSYDGARRPCVRYLDRLNFEVAEATDGEEALELILKTPPHVILTEWSLPVMPVQCLTQWLTRSWRTRDIPVIAIMSAPELETSAGVAGVLTKPFTLGTMLDELRRVLRTPAVKA